MSYFSPDTITFEAAMTDLAGGSEKAQVQAATALADAVTSEDKLRAAAALTTSLESGATAVRIAAARSLGMLGQSSGTGALIEATRSDVPALRQVAIIALGRLGLREGYDAALAALQEGPPDARFQAARTLVEIDADRAYQPLLDALDGEEDEEVVGAIALALGELGNRDAADALAGHLESTREETAFEVAYGLALLGDPRAARTLARFVETSNLSWDAVEGLERCAGDDAIEALAGAMLARKLGPELALRVASGLLALAPAHALSADARDALVVGLSAWKLHLRGLATTELGRVGGAWALPALRRLRGRRRGVHLVTEIDEAISRIEARGVP